MEFKKQFKPSVAVDFSEIKFYQIPFSFFAEWLNLVLELSKVIQPDFQVNIPKNELEWYHFPDREMLDLEGGTSYTLRSSSVLLKNGEYSIHLMAQYGYEPIPGQYILVRPNLTNGSLLSRNWMKQSTLDFEIVLEEKHLSSIEEVFYIFE